MSDEQQRDHTNSNGGSGRAVKVNERQALIGVADELRCSANRALTLQPFHCDLEAFHLAAEHYAEAAELYAKVGLSLYARQCLVEAAKCWEHLEDQSLAELLRAQAERIPVLWEEYE